MSVTSVARGQIGRAAFKFNTSNAWNTTNTEAALGAGDRVEYLLTGMPRITTENTPNESSPGGPAIRRFATKAYEGVAGPVPLLCGYATAQRIVAGWFGTEAVSVVSGASYAHLLTVDELQSGDAGTLGWSDGLMPHVIGHCKIQSLEFDFEVGRPGIVTVGILGKQELNDGSGANNMAAIDAAAYPTTIPALKYLMLDAAQAVVRIADNTDALDSGDEVDISRLTLRFTRGYATYRTSRNSPLIDEPISGEWFDVGGELTFPYEDGTTHRGLSVDTTECLLDIAFTGSQIGATGEDYKWTFEIPSVEIDTSGIADANTPSILPYTLPFQMHTADANPGGMAFTLPRLTIQDHVATSHLTNGT